jgi:hypothetical protein
MGPEPGLDAKNSPAKTTRSHTEIVKGTETVGVCTGAFTRALNPLDTADFVRDVLPKRLPQKLPCQLRNVSIKFPRGAARLLQHGRIKQ